MNKDETTCTVGGFRYGVEESADVFIFSEYQGKTVASIGDLAFSSCSRLTSITIPDSVVSIGAGAFNWCVRLTSITIPDSVGYIGSDAFSYCRNLRSIEFKGTIAQWKAISKASGWNYKSHFTVRCTDGKLDENGNEIS